MAWVRIHDGAMGNLKILRLSDSAFRLWIRGLCYCQTHLTDGLIPREALRSLEAKRRDVDMLNSVLVDGRAPLWESHAIGFKVHDYLLWNDCREKVQERQEKAKERKDAWMERRKNGVRNGVLNTSPLSTTKPNQTKPNTLPSEEKNTDPGFETFWASYPRKAGKEPARKMWAQMRPDADLLDIILSALEQHKRSSQWLKDGGQFIPHARTWLHQRRWTDEIEAPARPVGMEYRPFECLHEPRCNGRAACHLRQQIDAEKAAV